VLKEHYPVNFDSLPHKLKGIRMFRFVDQSLETLMYATRSVSAMIVDGFLLLQNSLVVFEGQIFALLGLGITAAINNQGQTGIWLRVLKLAECYDQQTDCFDNSAIEEKQFLKPSDNG
jgi:hypothetical protein